MYKFQTNVLVCITEVRLMLLAQKQNRITGTPHKQ